jgi:Protein of unknown function (DUF2442)
MTHRDSERSKIMGLLRISRVEALPGSRLRLTLTDGAVIERDVAPLLHGPVFERIASDPAEFAKVRAEGGTVAWPNGADLCPDVLIWNGPPPASVETSPAQPRARTGTT